MTTRTARQASRCWLCRLALCWIAAVDSPPSMDGGPDRLDGAGGSGGRPGRRQLADLGHDSEWPPHHGRRRLVRRIGIVLRFDPLGGLFTTLSLGVLLAALIYEVMGGVRFAVVPGALCFSWAPV